MAKPEWGKKRTCQNCGAKYYDLQKDPPTCPKCDTVFQVEQTTGGRRSRATAEAPKAIPAAAAAAAVNENSEVEVEESRMKFSMKRMSRFPRTQVTWSATTMTTSAW